MRGHGRHDYRLGLPNDKRRRCGALALRRAREPEDTVEMERRIMSAFDGVYTTGPALRLLPGKDEPSSDARGS